MVVFLHVRARVLGCFVEKLEEEIFVQISKILFFDLNTIKKHIIRKSLNTVESGLVL